MSHQLPMSRIAPLVAVLALAGACRDEFGGSDPLPSSVRSTLDPLLQQRASLGSRLCSCEFDDLGYESEAACLVGELITRRQRDCALAVLDGDQATAVPHLQCLLDATDALATCVPGTTCGETSRDACLSTFVAARDACPDLAAATADALSACFETADDEDATPDAVEDTSDAAIDDAGATDASDGSGDATVDADVGEVSDPDAADAESDGAGEDDAGDAAEDAADDTAADAGDGSGDAAEDTAADTSDDDGSDDGGGDEDVTADGSGDEARDGSGHDDGDSSGHD